jgi:mevalonate kinase
MILGEHIASTNKLIRPLKLYLQTLLRELEFKKPQLDELVNTAESLKTDANKLQLQSKGEFIPFICLS